MENHRQSIRLPRFRIIFIFSAAWLFSFCKSPRSGLMPGEPTSDLDTYSVTDKNGARNFQAYNRAPTSEEVADYLLVVLTKRKDNDQTGAIQAQTNSRRALTYLERFYGTDGVSAVTVEGKERFSKTIIRGQAIRQADYWTRERTYPLLSKFSRDILKVASCLKIDPIMFLGLIQHESKFDPAAQSTTGAKGLTQMTRPGVLETQAYLGGEDRLREIKIQKLQKKNAKKEKDTRKSSKEIDNLARQQINPVQQGLAIYKAALTCVQPGLDLSWKKVSGINAQKQKNEFKHNVLQSLIYGGVLVHIYASVTIQNKNWFSDSKDFYRKIFNRYNQGLPIKKLKYNLSKSESLLSTHTNNEKPNIHMEKMIRNQKAAIKQAQNHAQKSLLHASEFVTFTNQKTAEKPDNKTQVISLNRMTAMRLGEKIGDLADIVLLFGDRNPQVLEFHSLLALRLDYLANSISSRFKRPLRSAICSYSSDSPQCYQGNFIRKHLWNKVQTLEDQDLEALAQRYHRKMVSFKDFNYAQPPITYQGAGGRRDSIGAVTVRQIQAILKVRGIKINIDGDYGRQTQAALSKYYKSVYSINQKENIHSSDPRSQTFTKYDGSYVSSHIWKILLAGRIIK